MKERSFAGMAFALAAVLLTVLMIGYSLVRQDGGKQALIQPEYVDRLFSPGRVIEIEITMDEAELEDMLANAMKEEFHQAAVTVDGFKVANVAVRTKGNSSLFSIAGARMSEASSRYSFKIDFNEYIKGQNLYGLKKLNLNNCYSDPTYMREYLTYEIMSGMGLPTPGKVYVSLSINGKEWGLYLGVESIEEEFIARSFHNAKGDLYKPDGTGSDLKWISDDASDYSGMNLKTNEGRQDEDALIDFLSAVNGLGGDLSEVLDIDSALRYFAVSTALGNFDSYQGQMKHNYYLYEQDGYFSVIGWDYNMSFGGFAYMRTEDGAAVAIDEPVQGALEDRPLLAAILSVEEHRQKYYGYLREVAEGYLSEEAMQSVVGGITALIEPYIGLGDEGEAELASFKSSFTDDSGRTPSLLNFAREIRASILSQLDGELPKTSEELGIASTGMGGGRAGEQRPEGFFGAAMPPAMGEAPVRLDMPDVADMEGLSGILDDIRQNGLTEENRQKLLDMGLSDDDIDALVNGWAQGGPGQRQPDLRSMPGELPDGVGAQAGATPLPQGSSGDDGTAAGSPNDEASAGSAALQEGASLQSSVAQGGMWRIREDFLRPQQDEASEEEPISESGLIAAAVVLLALPAATIALGRVRMRRFRL